MFADLSLLAIWIKSSCVMSRVETGSLASCGNRLYLFNFRGEPDVTIFCMFVNKSSGAFLMLWAPSCLHSLCRCRLPRSISRHHIARTLLELSTSSSVPPICVPNLGWIWPKTGWQLGYDIFSKIDIVNIQSPPVLLSSILFLQSSPLISYLGRIACGPDPYRADTPLYLICNGNL